MRRWWDPIADRAEGTVGVLGGVCCEERWVPDLDASLKLRCKNWSSLLPLAMLENKQRAVSDSRYSYLGFRRLR